MNKKIPSLLLAIIFLVTITTLCQADPPEGYYASAIGKTESNLKMALHQIIDGHRVLPYTARGNDDWFDGNNMDVWEALVYTDSACSVTEPQCGLVQLLYLGEARHITKANRGSGGNDVWDREHVWPKSRGFPKKSQDGYTDLHHLRPADRNINSAHSNYGYDTGGKPIIDQREGQTSVKTEAKLDTAGFSFEPPNRAKGQVARMIFYMAVRYEPGDDKAPEHMPDLMLRDTNNRVKENWIGDLCTLLQWHNQFGPNDFERRRNDRVMEIQGNRNPFIDEPGWANLIWGNRCMN